MRVLRIIGWALLIFFGTFFIMLYRSFREGDWPEDEPFDG